MLVITALEDIIKAYRGDGSLTIAIDNAISALGYDPSNPQIGYKVSLDIEFEATSAEDAVKQFIALVFNGGVNAHEWVYEVEDEDGVKTSVDTYGWKAH